MEIEKTINEENINSNIDIKNTDHEEILNTIKKTYTDFTYPTYNEKMDENAPIPKAGYMPLYLESINHHIYNGKKNFDNFRILFAGCGLGSNILQCAEILKNHKNVEIVGIDISKSCIDVCKKE
jgi:2-polyprenyl-3-methyl-5-hydroxy-6-metoxy-1,4-benzoquinol methylase